MCVLSHVQLCVTPWTVAHQAPLLMEFARQECWSGLPSFLQGIFLTQRSNPHLLPLALAGGFIIFLPLCHLGSPLGGNCRNSEMLSCESSVSLLNLQPIENQHIYKDKAKKKLIKCASTLLKRLLIRCPVADKWIRKPWHIYRMEYYSAIKKNAFESILMRWMKLEPITQSEVSQKEKHQYSILMHIYGIYDDPICRTANETQM